MISNMIRTRPAPAAELVNIVIGIWIAVSPFVLGFTRTLAEWNNIAVGIALVVVTLLGLWKDEALQALDVPLAIWLFASPFVLGFTTTAFLANNVCMAFVVVTAGAVSDGLRTPVAES
jgi:FtsH-binding integral membrane protein